jgi:uncharacterized protein YegL
MPIIKSNKAVNPTEILSDGFTNVTMSITGGPEISQTPTDIMLVLDRSGSMNGQPFTLLQSAANRFVDIIVEATDGVLNGTIGGGSRIGVVSFETEANLDQPLTTNANAIKTTIKDLVTGNLTNIGQAFQIAQKELASSNPGSKKVLLIFTNGQANVGSDPDVAAATAREAGTEIFGIGLGFANQANINNWATDPAHVVIVTTADQLEQVFQNIAKTISKFAAVTNIVITDRVNNDFSVSNINASKGSAQLAGNIITWRIDSLAATDLETATLAYTATHNPARGGGVKRTNSSITYSDAQGQQIIFPDPTVLVRVPIPSSAIARGKLKEVVPSGRFKDELLNEMDLIDQLLAMSNIQGALAVLFTIVNKVKHRIKFWGCNTAVRLNLLLKDLELLEEAIELIPR